MNLSHAIIAAAVIASMPAIAQSRLVPVHDPAELAAAGFPPGTDKVWRLLDTQPDRPATRPDQAAGSSLVNTSTTVTAEDFQQSQSNGQYQAADYSQLQCSGGSPFFHASVRLPSGKRLKYLDVWGKNTSAFPITTTLLSVCKADDNPGTTNNTIIGQYISPAPGAGGYSDWVTLPAGIYTDTRHCAYMILAALGDSSYACLGSSQVFYKARVVWDPD